MTDDSKKPKTLARNMYYSAIKFKIRQRWEILCPIGGIFLESFHEIYIWVVCHLETLNPYYYSYERNATKP
jgi:hypothetical protein